MSFKSRIFVGNRLGGNTTCLFWVFLVYVVSPFLKCMFGGVLVFCFLTLGKIKSSSQVTDLSVPGHTIFVSLGMVQPFLDLAEYSACN